MKVHPTRWSGATESEGLSQRKHSQLFGVLCGGAGEHIAKRSEPTPPHRTTAKPRKTRLLLGFGLSERCLQPSRYLALRGIASRRFRREAFPGGTRRGRRGIPYLDNIETPILKKIVTNSVIARRVANFDV